MTYPGFTLTTADRHQSPGGPAKISVMDNEWMDVCLHIIASGANFYSKFYTEQVDLLGLLEENKNTYKISKYFFHVSDTEKTFY